MRRDMYKYTSLFFILYSNPLIENKKSDLKPDFMEKNGRGSRARTHKTTFGESRVTITLYPYDEYVCIFLLHSY